MTLACKPVKKSIGFEVGQNVWLYYFQSHMALNKLLNPSPNLLNWKMKKMDNAQGYYENMR